MSTAEHEQTTVLACANAGDTVIPPPLVILEGKKLNSEWMKGEVPCTLYCMSDKSWTDKELFSYWMKDLFLSSSHLLVLCFYF